MKFDINNIDNLLEKYWEGSTSLAEEAEIRSYFAHGDVAEQHVAFAPLFQHFSVLREMNTELDVETVLKDITEKPKKPFLYRMLSTRRYTMSIAAAMTVLLSAVTVFNLQMSSHSNKIVLDEAAETEEALRVTKEALALLSGKIDDSSKAVNSGVRKIKSASIIR